VNKPGEDVENLKGGVVGGSILKGVLRVGDEIEIRPGHFTREVYNNNKFKISPIRSKVVSLLAESNDLLYAVPGGLIGVGLQIDPSISRNDRLVGNVLGYPGLLPEIFIQIDVSFYLLKRLIGVKSEGDKAMKIQKIAQKETLKFNVGSTETPGKVLSVKDVNFSFSFPECDESRT
jgi:translation initiation factor 2 subunit 3